MIEDEGRFSRSSIEYPSARAISDLIDAVDLHRAMAPENGRTDVTNPNFPIFNGGGETKRFIQTDREETGGSLISLSEISAYPRGRATVHLLYSLSDHPGIVPCQIIRPEAVLQITDGDLALGLHLNSGLVNFMSSFGATDADTTPSIPVIFKAGLIIPNDEEIDLLAKLMWEDATSSLI